MQQNFYTTLKPLIIFLSCLGIVPYCFKKNKLCTSYIHSMYVVLLTVLYIAIFCDATFGNLRDLPKTSLISQIIELIVGTLQIILTFFNTLIRRKKFLKLSKAMFYCENGFKKIMEIPYKTTKKEIYMHAIVYIIILAPNLIIQLFLIKSAFLNRISKYCIDFAFPMVVNYSIGISAVAHILEIRRGFEVVNECLKRMQITKKWEKFKYENVLKQKLWQPNVENLAKLGRLHLGLNNCIREFNEAFCIMLVGNYVTAFVVSLVSIYFCYNTYLQSLYVFASLCAMVFSTYVSNITVLCQKCSSTIQEVKN